MTGTPLGLLNSLDRQGQFAAGAVKLKGMDLQKLYGLMTEILPMIYTDMTNGQIAGCVLACVTACLAALGLVLESALCVEFLLTGGKYKLIAASLICFS